MKLQGSNEIMGKKLTHWTKEQKTEAAIHYAIYGSLAKIERDLGIPKSTACIWKNKSDAVWVETVKQVQTEKGEEHRAKYVKIVDRAQDQVLATICDASAAQANLIACQATDKIRLHDGMPTSITANKDNRELSEMCKELSRTMRDHRVVSVQKDSSVQEENNG